MPEKVLMPSLGETITEATLIEWLKRDRDEVKKGDGEEHVENSRCNNTIFLI